jgi:DNA primase
LSIAVDFYHQNIFKHENAGYLQALMQETGLSKDTIVRFKIGLAGDSSLLTEHFKSMKVSVKDAIVSGLGVRTKEGVVDYFAFRTIFPLWRDGKPWFLTARRIAGATPDKHYEQGKYKHLRTNELVVLDQFVNEEIVESQNDLIITEGITDTCMAIEKGLPAIGVLGVSAFKQDWKKRLAGKNVFICFDNDEPGREGAKRIQALLKGSNIIRLPEEGMDLSDFFNKGHSVDEFNALLKSAEPDEKPIELGHLLDIEDPTYESKRVSVQIIIVDNSNAFRH